MPPPLPTLLDETLRTVARRYRLPAIAADPAAVPDAGAATTLALAIERARAALAGGDVPDPSVKRLFLDALARLVDEAMRVRAGDPVFQAMVLRHRVPRVRAYASLSAHAAQDRRAVHAIINAIAHPAKTQRAAPGPRRDALAALHALASSASWSALHDALQPLLATPSIADDPPLRHRLAQLSDSPALARLRRLDALASDEHVIRYRSLWDTHGPRPGSATAAARGVASQRRGAEVEAQAARALALLAQKLNDVHDGPAPYRVVTSMRVPASIPASPDRAKSEWDVVLLRRAHDPDTAPAWNVCLLVEAKASVDAATTDLPRLLRGLRLLGHADDGIVYPFETRQGVVPLRGNSLRALATEPAALAGTVLYCCDAPAEPLPRLLGAASRMQLLSARASLDYAGLLADGRPADPRELEPVWGQLLASPRWHAVLHQYPALRQVRDLMVHTDDLLAAVGAAGVEAGRQQSPG